MIPGLESFHQFICRIRDPLQSSYDQKHSFLSERQVSAPHAPIVQYPATGAIFRAKQQEKRDGTNNRDVAYNLQTLGAPFSDTFGQRASLLLEH